MGRVLFNPELEIQNMITEIKKYFVQNGGKTTKAIIGISGGKDSTIAAALLVRALGAENVLGVLMPCGEQADIADSYKVVEYLHIPHVEVNIGQAMEQLTEAIPGGLFGKNEVNMAAYHCLFSENPIMTLKYTFDIDGTEIIYNISYQDIDKHLKEDLFVDGVSVLDRDGSVAHVFMKEETLHTDVPKNTLFLRDVYFNTKFRGQENLQKWFQFLSNSVYLDLYAKRIIQYRDVDLSLKSYMEADGASRTNAFFDEHKFEQNIEYDKTRTEFLNGLGYKVIRFWNNDIDKNIEGVHKILQKEFGICADQPPP